MLSYAVQIKHSKSKKQYLGEFGFDFLLKKEARDNGRKHIRYTER